MSALQRGGKCDGSHSCALQSSRRYHPSGLCLCRSILRESLDRLRATIQWGHCRDLDLAQVHRTGRRSSPPTKSPAGELGPRQRFHKLGGRLRMIPIGRPSPGHKSQHTKAIKFRNQTHPPAHTNQRRTHNQGHPDTPTRSSYTTRTFRSTCTRSTRRHTRSTCRR